MKRNHWLVLGLMCVVLATGRAAEAAIVDGFEAATLDPFWSTTTLNGAVGFSTTQVHGGSQALELTTLGVSANKLAQVSHAFASPVYGTVSVWVYDSAADDLSGNYIELDVFNSILLTNARLFTQDYDLGPTNGGIYYYNAFDNTSTATAIDRTKDWHLFEIESLATSLKLSIDGTTVFSSAAGTPFDSISLTIHAPGFRPGLSAQYDDFTFTQAEETGAVPEPATVLFWSFGVVVGVLVARRGRRRNTGQ